MPRQSKGAHLWLRPARDRGDKGVERATWVIRDGGRQIATGCGASERREAEKALADHIASKYQPARRERDISEIWIADVLNVYLTDVAPRQARPEKCGERILRLAEFFGDKHLSDINGSTCRAYAEWRGSNGARAGAIFKTFRPQSIIMQRKGFIAPLSESRCLQRDTRANDG